MTIISIPPLLDPGAGVGASAEVRVQLVDERGRALIGLRASDGSPVTCTASYRLPAAGPAWEIDLTPQSAIAQATGAASYYALSITGPVHTEAWHVQVPDSADTVALADLIAGAATVDPADILAGRLLPLGGAAGEVLTKLSPGAGDAVWQAPDAASSGTLSAEAAVDLAAGQVLRVTPTALATLADASAPASAQVTGLAATDQTAGVAVAIARAALTLSNWTAATGAVELTPGAVYYLDPATPGALTTVAPDTTGQALVRLGAAASATTMALQIEPPITL
jgi:hypothetical protein